MRGCGPAILVVGAILLAGGLSLAVPGGIEALGGEACLPTGFCETPGLAPFLFGLPVVAIGVAMMILGFRIRSANEEAAGALSRLGN